MLKRNRHPVMLYAHGPSCFVASKNDVNLINSTPYLYSCYFYALNMPNNFSEHSLSQQAKRDTTNH